MGTFWASRISIISWCFVGLKPVGRTVPKFFVAVAHALRCEGHTHSSTQAVHDLAVRGHEGWEIIEGPRKVENDSYWNQLSGITMVAVGIHLQG